MHLIEEVLNYILNFKGSGGRHMKLGCGIQAVHTTISTDDKVMTGIHRVNIKFLDVVGKNYSIS